MMARRWHIDPDDPRAPPVEVWEQLSDEERAAVCASLPSEFAVPLLRKATFIVVPNVRAFEALEEFFRRTGRRVYLGSELPVDYPNERMLAPDIIAVFDVEPRERNRWVVSHEGKGIDVAIEILSAADPKKDLEDNVVRFARLGIPEYFVLDIRTTRLIGYRLPAYDSTSERSERGAYDSTTRVYEPIGPQQGRLASAVLGLDLEDRRVRFYDGSALLFEPAELIVRLEEMIDELVARSESTERERARIEEEKALAEQGKARAEREKARAEQEKARAEQEKARLAKKLRYLGIDPETRSTASGHAARMDHEARDAKSRALKLRFFVAPWFLLRSCSEGAVSDSRRAGEPSRIEVSPRISATLRRDG